MPGALSPQDVLARLGGSGSEVQNAVDHRIAIHECRHALVVAALNQGQVFRVVITPDGGEIHRREPDSTGLRSDHEAELAVLLAGRTAERLILGEVSSGAGGPEQSDLARATRLALALDTQLGLAESGTLWCDLPAEFALRDPELRASVKRRLDQAKALATEILTAHRTRLADMARKVPRLNRSGTRAPIGSRTCRPAIPTQPGESLGHGRRIQTRHDLAASGVTAHLFRSRGDRVRFST